MSGMASTLRRLAALNLPSEAMSEVLSIIADMQGADEERKAKDRERKRKIQGNSTEIPEEKAEQAPLPSLPPFSPPTPPPISPNPTNPPKINRQREIDLEFETRFWPSYPRKVAKDAAIKAFRKAREKASLDQILGGIATYRREKPEYADWAHPASWLNAGRWGDDYSAPTDGNVIPINAPVFESPEQWAEQLRARHAGKAV